MKITRPRLFELNQSDAVEWRSQNELKTKSAAASSSVVFGLVGGGRRRPPNETIARYDDETVCEPREPARSPQPNGAMSSQVVVACSIVNARNMGGIVCI